MQFQLLFDDFLFPSPALESQIQALYTAAATATKSVNAQGKTVAARLQDIPNRIQEIAGHGIHRGATVALAVVQTMSGNYFRMLQPIFPQGEAREEFEELVDEPDGIATVISDEIHVGNVINNVFADE